MELDYSETANPFSGIIITKQDLRDYGLLEHIRPMQEGKIDYLQQNLAESIEAITEELIQLRDSDRAAPDKDSLLAKINEIKGIVDDCKVEELSDADCEHILSSVNEVNDSVPRKNQDGKLVVAYPETPNLTESGKLFGKLKQNPQYIDTFKAWLDEAASFIEKGYSECIEGDRARILGLYTQDTTIMGFLKNNGIDEAKLKNLIAVSPGRMELNYRRLRQIKKEKLYLIEANSQLQHIPSAQHTSKTAHVADFMKEVRSAMGFRGNFSRKYQILHANELRVINSETPKELETALKDFLSAVLTRRIKGISSQTTSGKKFVELLNTEQNVYLKDLLGLAEVGNVTYENLVTAAAQFSDAHEVDTEQEEISYSQSLSLFSVGNKQRLYQAYELTKKNDEISDEQANQMDGENLIYNPHS